MQARQAQIVAYGGPEVIQWREVELGAPGPGELLVRHTSVGLNYIDTYHRSGIYPTSMPTGLGIEAAGVVEAVGDGVTVYAPGDRIAMMKPPLGAYATARIISESQCMPLPNDISDETAAAVMIKGCTAEFLIERCAKVESGWSVLVHAAAGGTGQMLCQWLKHIGAHVIGTTSSEAKAEKARAAGAEEIIFYDEEDTAARVHEITSGAGVRVVFDGIGMSTWESSLDSLGERGLMVSFGNADAPVTDVSLGILAQKGSLFVTRPTLFNYYSGPEEENAGFARVFEMLRSGVLEIEIGQRYPLEDAAQAHKDLENRKTIGSTILIP